MGAWKPVVCFEGLYEISDAGLVRSLRTGIVLSRRKDKDGYLLTDLCVAGAKTTLKVHREVCKAFLPNPENKPHVNHKDGDRANASLSNLEWATISENHLHAYGELNRQPPSERAVIAANGFEELKFDSVSEAGRRGFNRKAVHLCLNGSQKVHNGYNWRYANG